MPGTTKPLAEFGPNLLCIVPPYPVTVPPAGAAALLGHMRAHGHTDFGFLDLRLWVPQAYAVTYSAFGAFGESYVMDVPDLPMVLALIRSFEEGRPYKFAANSGMLFQHYCLERGINPGYLGAYLQQMDRFLDEAIGRISRLDFVGFTVWTSNYLTTLMAAARLKSRRPETYVVAGGPGVTESAAAAHLALRAGLFDAVALGEGEESLRTLFEAYRAGESPPFRSASGTLQRDPGTGGVVAIERPRSTLLKLATLPCPDFGPMDLAAYQAGNRHERVLPLQLSRGCTDKCTFCSEWGFWERFRVDEVGHVLDLVEEYRARYDINGVAFTDSLLNGSMDRLREFAEGILRRGLTIRWGGFLRARMDAETASLLKRAGFVLAFIGIESFSDETLALMNKRRTMGDNVLALEALLDAGIAVRAGFIPGFPGDDRHRFLQTALTYRELQVRYPGLLSLSIEPFTVSPGQPIARDLAAYGLSPHPWDGSCLDLAPAYRDLTEMINCTVTGANQGVERLGQYQLAVALSQDSRSRSRTILMASTIRDSDFMYYSYNPEEQEETGHLDFDHLFGDLYLATCKTASSLVYGCLVRRAERDAYCRLLGTERLVHPWSSSHALLDNAVIGTLLQSIEDEHVLKPRRLRPKIIPVHYRRELSSEDRLTASPFVVTRQIEGESGPELVLAHLINRHTEKLPVSYVAVLNHLADIGLSIAELLRMLREQKSSEGERESLAQIERLKELGMLVVIDEKTLSGGCDIALKTPLAPQGRRAERAAGG